MASDEATGTSNHCSQHKHLTIGKSCDNALQARLRRQAPPSTLPLIFKDEVTSTIRPQVLAALLRAVDLESKTSPPFASTERSSRSALYAFPSLPRWLL